MGRQVIAKAQPMDCLFVGSQPGYIAYFVDGSDLVAVTVSQAGGYLTEIGRAPDASEFAWDRASRVFSDSSATIGSDSIVWCRGERGAITEDGATEPGSNGLFVADVRNGTTYALTSGFDGDMAGAGFVLGQVYCITWEYNTTADTNTVRCYQANPDLTGFALHGTLVVEKADYPQTPTWLEMSGIGVSGGGAILAGLHHAFPPPADVTNHYAHVFFPVSGDPEWGVGPEFNGPQVGAPWGVRSIAANKLHPGELWVQEEFGYGWDQIADFLAWDWEFQDERFEIYGYRNQTYGDPTGEFAITYFPAAQQIARFIPTIEPEPEPEFFLTILDHPTYGVPQMIVPV